jgi:acyl-CoA thioesterase-2
VTGPDGTVTVDALTDALALEADGPGGFCGTCPDWWGGERVFGGMVVAQTLRAAQLTVDPSVPVHSLHGYFLRPVEPGAAIRCDVARLRDGRSFTTRQVTMSVGGRDVFTMISSFHRPEEGDEYQLAMPTVPGPDDVVGFDPPTPFEVRELGPTPRRPDGSYEATRRVWLRARGDVPEDPAIHACLLAYLSDMTGAAFRPLSLSSWGGHTDASLDHAVWFHTPARADRWLLFELQAVSNVAGRAAVRGQMFTESGTLHTSMAQELLIRPLDEPVVMERPGWAERSSSW